MYLKRFLCRLVSFFTCAIVYTTINNDIADTANNVKFSKFKTQFLGLNLRKCVINLTGVKKHQRSFATIKCKMQL